MPENYITCQDEKGSINISSATDVFMDTSVDFFYRY